MIEFPYEGRLAESLNQYFKDNVFVIGVGPDFIQWVAEQGGHIYMDPEVHKKWMIRFDDPRQHTLFMLKYEA